LPNTSTVMRAAPYLCLASAYGIIKPGAQPATRGAWPHRLVSRLSQRAGPVDARRVARPRHAESGPERATARDCGNLSAENSVRFGGDLVARHERAGSTLARAL